MGKFGNDVADFERYDQIAGSLQRMLWNGTFRIVPKSDGTGIAIVISLGSWRLLTLDIDERAVLQVATNIQRYSKEWTKKIEGVLKDAEAGS